MWLLKQLRRTRRQLSGRGQAGQVVYSLPDATVYRKYFNQDQLFDEIEWSNWARAIDGFEQRFAKWYFDNMRGSHASYVDLCALCALIDVFSLHLSRTGWHAPRTFKELLRRLDPVFRRRLPSPILATRLDNGSWIAGSLKDVADVFYTGVRCSLHHHGDLAAYAGMSGTGQIARIIPDAGHSVCGIHTYSLVVFDPDVLKHRLRQWLAEYCCDLRAAPSSEMAHAFRSRIKNDFGIVVP